jgi:hypothetical protein
MELVSPDISIANLDVDLEDVEQVQVLLSRLSDPELMSSSRTSYIIDEHKDPLLHHLDELRDRLLSLQQVRDKVRFHP